MSLICGILSREDPALASAAALEAMLDRAPHRARDGLTTFVDAGEGVALGYAYTASFGQPEESPSWHEDEHVVAAVDGHVYEAAALAGDREPATRSIHAGAVVASFAKEPAAFPRGLDGVFSLFLWDRRHKALHLAADPLAHKLVYYYEDPARGLLVFSTELKAVLAHPAVPRSFDEAKLPMYLAVGFPAPPFTLVKGVRKLLPSECLLFSPSGKQTRRYWRPRLESGPEGDLEFWTRRSREELVAAVRRTAGDADRVAVYLSGGLDSSVVLAALKQAGGIDVQAFTLTFGADTIGSDEEWSRRAAEATGTPHQVLSIDRKTGIDPEVVAGLIAQIDEPFESSTRVINQYFLGRASSQAGFNSTLSGAQAGAGFVLRTARRLIERGFSTDTVEQALLSRFATPGYVGEESMRRALAFDVDLSPLKEAALVNLELLQDLEPLAAMSLNGVLNSSARRQTLFYQFIPPLLGLDERTPFLDTRLAQFAAAVPPRFKGIDSPAMDKAVLLDAFRDELQMDFRRREKRVYPNPRWPAWLKRRMVPGLQPLVDDGILRPQYTAELKQRLKVRDRQAKKEAWHWFAFSCWYQLQIQEKDPLAGVA